jgi:hypothetical protein
MVTFSPFCFLSEVFILWALCVVAKSPFAELNAHCGSARMGSEQMMIPCLSTSICGVQFVKPNEDYFSHTLGRRFSVRQRQLIPDRRMLRLVEKIA